MPAKKKTATTSTKRRAATTKPNVARAKPTDATTKANEQGHSQPPAQQHDQPQAKETHQPGRLPQPAQPSVSEVEPDQPKPAPPPLVRTTYNQQLLSRILAFSVVAIVIGVAILAWMFRGTFMQWQSSTAQDAAQPWVNLPAEQIDEERLAAILESTPSAFAEEASSTPLIEPSFWQEDWDKQPTDKLFLALLTAQQSLKSRHISDFGVLDGLVADARQAQSTGDDQAARTNLLRGLQLVMELQQVHQYYQPDSPPEHGEE